MEQNKVQPFVATEVGLTPSQMKELNIADPEMVVALAKEVKKYVTTQELTVKIQGSDYVQVEGWQFAASLLGLIGKVVKYENKSVYGPITFSWQAWDKTNRAYVEKKHTAVGTFRYFAEAVLENADGKVVGQGFAMCSNEELKKHTFDEYAIFSMAQTRAIGKAARMALAFLIKAAGFEPTPAEEMMDVEAVVEAKVVEIPLTDEIRQKIGEFDNADALANWANGQAQYHRNKEFLATVRRRIKELS